MKTNYTTVRATLIKNRLFGISFNKFNLNGPAFIKGLVSVATGGLIRDDRGIWVKGFMGKLGPCITN